MSTSMMRSHLLTGGTVMFIHSASSFCRTRVYSAHDQRTSSHNIYNRQLRVIHRLLEAPALLFTTLKTSHIPPLLDIEPLVRMC
jgi:hypothetical protein